MIKIVENREPSVKQTDNIFASRLVAFDTRITPLLVFGLSGLIGILVDADHFTNILFDRLAIRPENLSGRGLHIPFFVVVCLIWCFSITYVYRLYVLVLEDRFEKGEL